MISLQYDAGHDALCISFEGDVDAAQVERALAELPGRLPGHAGFKVLADFTAIGRMEPEVKDELEKAMDILSARGVGEVLRVLPDPDWDFAFDILSRSHYPHVPVRTARSRSQARQWLERRPS